MSPATHSTYTRNRTDFLTASEKYFVNFERMPEPFSCRARYKCISNTFCKIERQEDETMLGYYKGQPNDHIIKFVNGRVAREGDGISFFFMSHNTTIAAVPTTSRDANFVFNEITNSFQSVTIQGQCTYRIVNARLAAGLLNFTVDAWKGKYVSDDPERVPQRITNIIQMETRGEIQKRSLEETLGQTESIAASVLRRIREGGLLDPIGVEILNIYFVAAKPTPEVGKALEAQYRESLLRKADEAIYARRAAAVEEERKIKENELSTDITLEQRRHELIDLQGTNTLQEAEFRGQALVQEGDYKAQAIERELSAYRGQDPRLMLALAMKELGANAGNIGNLTVTTEMLSSLLNAVPSIQE